MSAVMRHCAKRDNSLPAGFTRNASRATLRNDWNAVPSSPRRSSKPGMPSSAPACTKVLWAAPHQTPMPRSWSLVGRSPQHLRYRALRNLEVAHADAERRVIHHVAEAAHPNSDATLVRRHVVVLLVVDDGLHLAPVLVAGGAADNGDDHEQTRHARAHRNPGDRHEHQRCDRKKRR